MRANLIVALALAAMALAPSLARAMPNHCFPGVSADYTYRTYTMASIGDSISQGVDAWDDGCHTISDYVGRLGSDWNGSWAVGDATSVSWGNGYSVKSRLTGNVPGVAKPYIAFQTKSTQNLGYGYGRESAEANALNLSNLMQGRLVAPNSGDKWSDGPAQAQSIVNACNASGGYLGASQCPQVVTIELGGNDICQNGTAPVWDADSTTGWYIDETARILGLLPYGTEVWVNVAPNLETYRQQVKGKRNWVFRTCQDMWNLDTSQIDLSAKVCDVWLICDIADTLAHWMVEVTTWFLPTLQYVLKAVFNVDTYTAYPCYSQNGNWQDYYCNLAPTDPYRVAYCPRDKGIAKNTYINNKLISKFCAYGVQNPTYCRDYGTWYGNSHFFLATTIKDTLFNEKQVSTLDCFHPSRSGQELMAATFYNDLCTGGTQPANCAGPAPTNSRALSYVWHPNQGKYQNRFTMQTTCSKSQVCMYMRRYNAIGTSASVNYEKVCEQQFADTHDIQFNVTTPGYYYIAWEIQDLGGWRYPSAYYPPEVFNGTYYYLY